MLLRSVHRVLSGAASAGRGSPGRPASPRKAAFTDWSVRRHVMCVWILTLQIPTGYFHSDAARGNFVTAGLLLTFIVMFYTVLIQTAVLPPDISLSARRGKNKIS